MKHKINVTIIIITVFIITQLLGLTLVKEDITLVENINGTIIIHHGQTAIGERPETEGAGSFLYLTAAIIIGTILMLIIIKYGKIKIWKTWFFLAIFLSTSIALGVLINHKLAFIAALILTTLKISKPNIITHNLTEVLMYSGLAVLIVPIFDLQWMIIILAAISIYDMYAVWKSKHMIKMAEFQGKTKMFAGLMIPYQEEKGIKLKIPEKPSLQSKNKKSKKEIKNAILGGGDVAFPLIFTGVVMEHLIKQGLTINLAFAQSIIIIITTGLAVTGLFVFSKKNKFYPAMPFISIGCLLGYGLILLL